MIKRNNQTFKIAAAVLSRMNSSRLPGKALIEVNKKPIVDYVFESLENLNLEIQIVLATSTERSDNLLEEHARHRGIKCIRGDLNDVAKRLLLVIDETDCDAVFRVNGDSPFIQSDLFSRAIENYCDNSYDLVTNIWPRTYPPGISVELIRADCYRNAYNKMLSQQQREHVTRFLYDNADDYRIHNLESSVDYSNYHMAIDRPEDLAIFKKMVLRMDKDHSAYSVAELIEIYDQVK